MHPLWLPVTIRHMKESLLDLIAYIRVYGRAAATVAFLLLLVWVIIRPLFATPDI